MKKLFKVLIILVLLVGGVYHGGKYLYKEGYVDKAFEYVVDKIFVTSTSENNSESNNITSDEKISSESYNFPDEWTSLFKFENASLAVTNYFMGTKVTYYKFVDSICYQYNEENSAYEEFDSQYIYFDYTQYYEKFILEGNVYTATEIYSDKESSWTDDVKIYLKDDKIDYMTVDKHLASLHIQYLLTFSDYGTTVLN